VHYSSDGYAEFNWRFVYSKLGVRKGFPIESEISIGLYENRVLGTDFFMCEGVLDLKPYLQHAAAQQTSFSIEAEIPLTNRRLLELLQSRLAYEREKENVLRSADLRECSCASADFSNLRRHKTERKTPIWRHLCSNTTTH